MLIQKVRQAVVVGILGCCWQSVADHNPTAAAQSESAVFKSKPTDCYSDPLPPGAVSRLGTIRMRHPGGAGALAFSPDNELLASGAGHSVRLWELKTGKELHEFASVSASCLAFSPDGKTLASGEWEGDIVFWDVRTKKETQRLLGHKQQVYSVAFSTNGKLLASGGRDGAARIWDLETGQEKWLFKDHKADVQSVAFSPDDALLATGGRDGIVRLWRVATGKQIDSFQKQPGQPLSLSFSPDSKRIICASSAGYGQAGELNIWDVSTRENLRKHKGGHWFTAAVSPGGNLLAIQRAGSEGVEIVPISEEGKSDRTLPKRSMCSEMAFSPDGKLLATNGPGSAICIWDAGIGKPRYEIGEHYRALASLAFVGQGRYVVTGNTDEAILWESATGKKVCLLAAKMRSDPVIAGSPDGKVLAVGFQVVPAESKIVLLDVGKPDIIRQIPPASDEAARHFELEMLGRPCMVFSRDNSMLITPDTEGSLTIWDVASGTKKGKLGAGIFGAREMLYRSLAFSPNGKTITAAGIDARNSQVVWRQWDVASRVGKKFTSGKRAWTAAPGLSPDGETIAFAGDDDVIRVYGAATGKELISFVTVEKSKSGQLFLVCLALSPDGRTVASANTDSSIRLWEVATGKERHCFHGHRAWSRRLAFSQDGKYLASASEDTTALVWDLRNMEANDSTGKELAKLWDKLAEQDARQAYQAICAFVSVSDRAIPFLQKRLKPVQAADAANITRWLAQLDDPEFDTRDNALKQLAEAGDQIAPELKKALESKPDLETRRRIQMLLKQTEIPWLPPDRLRELRALEVLEAIVSKDAKELLQTLVKGMPEARLTREAKAALDRRQ